MDCNRCYKTYSKRDNQLYMDYGKGYRDCIKRNGDKTRIQSTRYIVTSCHGNDDKMWSTSCLIMQHKPYIVDQPPPHPFKSHYHYTKVHMPSFSVYGQRYISINIMLFHSGSVMASIAGRCDSIHWEEWNYLQGRVDSALVRNTIRDITTCLQFTTTISGSD